MPHCVEQWGGDAMLLVSCTCRIALSSGVKMVLVCCIFFVAERNKLLRLLLDGDFFYVGTRIGLNGESRDLNTNTIGKFDTCSMNNTKQSVLEILLIHMSVIKKKIC